jgi:hypothetical protein
MFFLFFDHSGLVGYQFSAIFMIGGFSVFFMIIIGVSIAVAATSKNYNVPRNKTINGHYGNSQKNVNVPNPYKVLRPIESEKNDKFEKNNRRDIAVVEEIVYCRYCGARRERDAIFCHMCGTKL